MKKRKSEASNMKADWCEIETETSKTLRAPSKTWKVLDNLSKKYIKSIKNELDESTKSYSRATDTGIDSIVNWTKETDSIIGQLETSITTTDASLFFLWNF